MDPWSRLFSRDLILDFDGVITSLTVNWSKLKQALAEAYKVNTFQSLSDFFQLAQQLNQPNQYLNLVARYELDQIATAKPSPLFCQILQQQKHFCIFSSNTKKTITTFLQCYHGLELADMIIAADDVTCMKPNPEGLIKITHHYPNRDFVYIGDQTYDEIAANSQNIDFLNYQFQGEKICH